MADPKFSAGARLERAAMRAYLRRYQRSVSLASGLPDIEAVLQWVLKRERRYNKKKGGLGK